MTSTMHPTAQYALTPAERRHFVEHGYVKIEAAFSRDLALDQVRKQFAKEGMDADKPESWKSPVMRIGPTESYDLLELSPRLWAAACEILGGEDRVLPECRTIRNHMIANNFHDEGKTWEPPGDKAAWHKDGQFFRHFLDSPEQALLSIVLWSDVISKGGATYIAPESIGPVARHLAQHPEGVHPLRFPWAQFMAECPNRIEATGQAGDVYLMHSYMLHTLWMNPSRKLRCIDNGIFALKEPMQFNRPDPADFSLLEQAVLRGLGKDRFDFKPTRERIRTPDWSVLPKEQE